MADLLSSLHTSFAPLLSPSHSLRQPATRPISALDLTQEISTIWSESPQPVLPDLPELTDNSSDEEKSNVTLLKKKRERELDMLRSVLDVLGRDIIIGPIASGELTDPFDGDSSTRQGFQREVQDRMDIVLTLFEVVYASYTNVPILEPGAIFIPILEELVELLSVESWRDLWVYVETRSRRFTKNMPPSRGKALPLLRTINAFLRFLPRTPEDLVFRGRVHQFASSVIGIADKSAINMRGEYAKLQTTWEAEEAKAEAESDVKEKDGDGDVKMDGSKDAEGKESADEAETMDFYSTLWSLQAYFSSPPLLAGNVPPPAGLTVANFEDFKKKSDFVLPKLFEQTQKAKELMGKEKAIAGQKRKRADGDAEGFFHPRYLTGQRLFEQELADPSFRRQILAQYFILFQFLLNLTPASAAKQAFTGGMHKDFRLDAEMETWVKSRITMIMGDLQKMPDEGDRFKEIVVSMIKRERHYAQWKNDGCPESLFEVPAMDGSTADEAAEAWRKRLQPPRKWRSALGTRGLTSVWTTAKFARNKKRSRADVDGWKALSNQVNEVREGEADDEAMGTLDPSKKQENSDKITTLHWRGIRMASSSQLRHFGALAHERDVTILEAAVNGTLKRNTESLAAAKAAEREAEDTVDNGEASDGEDVLGLRAGTAKEEPEKEAEVEGGMEVDAPAEAADLGEGGEVKDTEGEDTVSKEATPTVHEDEVDADAVKVEETAAAEAEVKVEERDGGEAEQVEKLEEVEEGKPLRPATPDLPDDGDVQMS